MYDDPSTAANLQRTAGKDKTRESRPQRAAHEWPEQWPTFLLSDFCWRTKSWGVISCFHLNILFVYFMINDLQTHVCKQKPFLRSVQITDQATIRLAVSRCFRADPMMHWVASTLTVEPIQLHLMWWWCSFLVIVAGVQTLRRSEWFTCTKYLEETSPSFSSSVI